MADMDTLVWVASDMDTLVWVAAHNDYPPPPMLTIYDMKFIQE